MSTTLVKSQMLSDNQSDDGLKIDLTLTPSSAPVNTDIQAEAKVTQDGFLEQGYGVQLVISDCSAIFDSGSDKGKQTTTQNTGAMGRVDVKLTDATPQSGIITATIVTYPDGSPYPNGPSDQKQFTFTPATHSYDLEFNPPLANDEPADGHSADEGQVYVTEDGGRLDASQVVLFTFDTGSADFVLSGDSNIIQSRSDSKHLYVQTHYDDELGQDIANASFVDNNVEGVTLRAKLDGHPEVNSPTQGFTFVKPSPPYPSARIVSGVNTPGGPIYFDVGSGFPTTAFANAAFQLQPTGNGDDNNTFKWQSNDACATVDNAGNVTFVSQPTRQFMITATPLQGENTAPFQYTIAVKSWLAAGTSPPSQDSKWQVADITMLTGLNSDNLAAWEGEANPKFPTPESFPGLLGKIGNLFGEWGQPATYSDDWKLSGASALFATSTTFQNGSYPGMTFFVYTDLGEGQWTISDGAVTLVDINAYNGSPYCWIYNL